MLLLVSVWVKLYVAAVKEDRVGAGRWWKLLANCAEELQLLVVRPPRDPHLVDTFLQEMVDPHTDRRPLLSQVFR